MGEFAPQGPELQNLAELERNAEHLLPDVEHATEVKPGEQNVHLSEARQAIAAETAQAEVQPNPLERFQTSQEAAQPAPAPAPTRELRNLMRDRKIKQVQRELPAAQRNFSKVVHQPVVRAVSEAAGQTISRPSGLLGGGIVALLGTSSYLYLAKHLGFTYNYFVFLALFVVGFAFGLLLEFFVYLATRSRRAAE